MRVSHSLYLSSSVLPSRKQNVILISCVHLSCSLSLTPHSPFADSMIRVGGDYQAQIPEFRPGELGKREIRGGCGDRDTWKTMQWRTRDCRDCKKYNWNDPRSGREENCGCIASGAQRKALDKSHGDWDGSVFLHLYSRQKEAKARGWEDESVKYGVWSGGGSYISASMSVQWYTYLSWVFVFITRQSKSLQREGPQEHVGVVSQQSALWRHV